MNVLAPVVTVSEIKFRVCEANSPAPVICINLRREMFTVYLQESPPLDGSNILSHFPMLAPP